VLITLLNVNVLDCATPLVITTPNKAIDSGIDKDTILECLDKVIRSTMFRKVSLIKQSVRKA